MRHIILNQNESLGRLPLSFNNNILEVKKQLDAGYPVILVTQVQVIKNKIFKVQTIIRKNNIFQLFGDQVELLLNILRYINENIEPYERYDLLKGLISEINMIKDLPTQPWFTILSNHIDFMKTELIPIIKNHLIRIDDTLKIKNHKSFVRKRIAEKGLVTFVKGTNERDINEILEYLNSKCSDDGEFKALNGELMGSSSSHLEFYSLSNVMADDIILLFKIMKDRQIISKISNKDLSKWLYRKFRYLKNGEYIVGLAQRTIWDRLNSKLTAKENLKKLDINFKK